MYNTALIENMLSTQFQDRLVREGVTVFEQGSSFHGHPTQFDAIDNEGRPLSFRLRSNRATFVRGERGQSIFEMFDAPTAWINVRVPEGTMAEEAFFALRMKADREGQVVLELV